MIHQQNWWLGRLIMKKESFIDFHLDESFCHSYQHKNWCCILGNNVMRLTIEIGLKTRLCPLKTCLFRSIMRLGNWDGSHWWARICVFGPFSRACTRTNTNGWATFQEWWKLRNLVNLLWLSSNLRTTTNNEIRLLNMDNHPSPVIV